jgi:hypothetical protein
MRLTFGARPVDLNLFLPVLGALPAPNVLARGRFIFSFTRDSDENPSFATPATTILSKERDAVKRQKSPRHEEKSFDSVSFCETS